MAGVKISNLPAIVAPALTDLFATVQSGVTYKETLTQLSTLFAVNNSPTITTPILVRPDIIGVTDGSLAPAGSVGEIISSAVVDTTLNVTSGVVDNVTSISLTAGDWDLSAMAVFAPAPTTDVSEVIAAISLTSATLPGTITPAITQPTARFSAPGLVFSTGGRQVLDLTTATINVSVTTTVYLVVFSQFAVSTMTAGGMIRARRMR